MLRGKVFVRFFSTLALVIGLSYLTAESGNLMDIVMTASPRTEKSDPQALKMSYSVYDHIYFSSYDGSRVYTNEPSTAGRIQRKPLRMEAKMFREVKNKAVKYLQKNVSRKYKEKDCQNIRYRLVPTIGLEIDAICSQPESRSVDRITFLQRLRPSEVIFHKQKIEHSMINIVMPLMGRPETFRLFLENLKKVMSEDGNTAIGLTLTYFNDSKTAEIRQMLEKAADVIPRFTSHFILLETQPFSRSKGLQVGVEESKINASVVFLCDVDVFFTKDFLLRCQSNPVQGYQVYFPTIFSLHNPEFIYALKGANKPKPLDTLHVGDGLGYWRVWGHGMVCVYKSDFLKIKGFDKRRNGWGGEDLNFAGSASGKKYKIIRALDSGLMHLYHPKNCTGVPKNQLQPCLKVQALTEAASQSFGLWYFRQKYNQSVYGILKDGPEPYTEEQVLREHDTCNDVMWTMACVAISVLATLNGLLLVLLFKVDRTIWSVQK